MAAGTAMAPIKLSHHDEAVFLAIATWADDGVCTKPVGYFTVQFGNPRSIYRTFDKLRCRGFITGHIGALRPLRPITDLWPY